MRMLAIAAAMLLGITAAAAQQDTPPPLPGADAPAPPPVLPAVQYFVGENGKQVGPLTQQQVEERIKAGTTKRDDFVWKTGQAAWAKAETFGEFQAVLQQAAPPPMPEDGKYKQVMIGTWETSQDLQGSVTTTRITYAADGRYAGFAVMTSPNAQPLQAPLAGTWTVKPAGPETFALTLQDQNGRTGTVTVRVIDATTLEDLGSGGRPRKVGM